MAYAKEAAAEAALRAGLFRVDIFSSGFLGDFSRRNKYLSASLLSIAAAARTALKWCYFLDLSDARSRLHRRRFLRVDTYLAAF